VPLDAARSVVAAAGDVRAYRLSGIDMLRGLAIVVMALDHVRDFFLAGAVQDPMADPNIPPALFATRWITHFCAPVFVLLAGTSAGLMAARKTPFALGRFLLTRGLWLIAVEWFVISTAFTFAPGGVAEHGQLVLVPMQVIWAIGASMVVLAAAQFLGRGACLALGLMIVCGHNLLDGTWPRVGLFEQGAPLWVALHSQMAAAVGPFMFIFIYPLLPWVGLMLIGYGSARVFELPAPDRDALLLRAGLALTAAFFAVRAIDVYGDPNPWQFQTGGMIPTIIDFLNTTKYPPSLAFLLMTLGPAVVLCALADRISGTIKSALVMFGRVPFAFYVAHFYLIHALSVGLGVAQGFDARQFLNIFYYYPVGYGVSLPGVYAVWALVIVLLYPFCSWVAAVKARRRDWWLSYL
jgi:uncharacterized membrane protein